MEVRDVRGGGEWHSGHLPRARHLHLPDLPAAIPDLPEAETWVHCRGGFRAAISASLLAAAGHQVVLIDDTFEPGVVSAVGVSRAGHVPYDGAPLSAGVALRVPL